MRRFTSVPVTNYTQLVLVWPQNNERNCLRVPRATMSPGFPALIVPPLSNVSYPFCLFVDFTVDSVFIPFQRGADAEATGCLIVFLSRSKRGKKSIALIGEWKLAIAKMLKDGVNLQKSET